MKWTRTKPTKPGYYFYRDSREDHDVVPVDYMIYDKSNLAYWNEWDKSWILVEEAPDDVEWSSELIAFPEEPKKENPWLSYGKEGNS